ncbi:MAG: flagellar motor protein MotB [Gammaproteobacteria bacterium]|nr:flagellar motor protein MotB [Gammaproteobacteria bacterium]
MAENAQPIIIKKVKKGGHGGHHGGSWKVAYADFVTAMMAFFLLLWLLSSTNQETLTGIADYFNNPSAINAAGGASTSMIDLGSNIDISRGDGERNRESDSYENYSEAFQQMELQQLEELKASIEEAIDNNPTISAFKDQILMEITDEGLLIQIIDKNKRPMFDSGSAVLKEYAKEILHKITPIINSIPNKVSISGHTDARRYMRSDGYSNWELSSDRANAARRELVHSGMPIKKIARVEGLASKFLLDPKKPFDPRNRRMSILVLKKKSEDSLYREQGATPEPLEDFKKKIKNTIEKHTEKKVSKEKVKDAIRSGTTRHTGTIVRFRD